MLTRIMWREYIGCCTSYYYNRFENDYGLLILTIIGTPFVLCADIISSPFQLLALAIGKLLDKKYSK